MEKRLIKKRFADLNLKPILYKCLNCGEERVNYSFSGGEWEATVECGICSAIVVFDIFNIPEADNFFFGSRKIEGYSELP